MGAEGSQVPGSESLMGAGSSWYRVQSFSRGEGLWPLLGICCILTLALQLISCMAQIPRSLITSVLQLQEGAEV